MAMKVKADRMIRGYRFIHPPERYGVEGMPMHDESLD